MKIYKYYQPYLNLCQPSNLKCSLHSSHISQLDFASERVFQEKFKYLLNILLSHLLPGDPVSEPACPGSGIVRIGENCHPVRVALLKQGGEPAHIILLVC